MAKGFEFNGTNRAVSLADAAGYDVSPNGDSFTMSFWINPESRTSEEILFDRNGWFKVALQVDDYVRVEFADGSARRFGPIQNDVKTHIMFSLQNKTAVATGTADTDVANLLIDLDANWYTNGVDDPNPVAGDYIVYNRTDRTWDYGYVIDDVTFTASATTVDTSNDTIDLSSHSYIDGTPTLVKGSDVPAGTADDGTIYYIGDATGGKIYLYDTAAHAVTNDGSTGLINLTDTGSGTVTLRVREDAILLNSDLCPDGNESVLIFEPPWQATFRAWINGVRQDIDETITHFNTPADTDTVIWVGKLTAGSNWYDGLMNNVTYWTAGIATDEIASAVYNGGTELTTASGIGAVDGAMTLYAHWPFDETAAATAVDNDEGTAARDGTASETTDGITAASLDATTYYAADTILEFTAASSVTGVYLIKGWEWIGSTTAADDLVVNDAAGNALIVVDNKIANDSAGQMFPSGHPLYANGITVATIDAGTLRIYLA